MMCVDGRCQCTVGTMTSDRQHCLSDNEKLLSDYCLPAVDVCLHLGGMSHVIKLPDLSVSVLHSSVRWMFMQ